MEESTYLQLAFTLCKLNKKQQKVVRDILAYKWEMMNGKQAGTIVRGFAEQLESLDERKR